MLSHTQPYMSDSSNIIKHINIVSEVHKNYSSKLQWFSLNLFHSSYSIHWAEAEAVRVEVAEKPKFNCSFEKYLSSSSASLFAAVSTELRIVLLRMRHFSKSTFNMSRLQAIFQLWKFRNIFFACAIWKIMCYNNLSTFPARNRFSDSQLSLRNCSSS